MTSDTTVQFKELLLASIKRLRVLRDILQRERSILEARDIEGLQRITAEKNDVLEQIQHDTEARNRFLQQQGHSADETGVEAFLDSLDASRRSAFEKGWQQLKAVFDEVQQANRVNGRIVNRSQQQINQLLSLLQPRSNTPPPNLYSASGAKGDGGQQRSFGKA